MGQRPVTFKVKSSSEYARLQQRGTGSANSLTSSPISAYIRSAARGQRTEELSGYGLGVLKLAHRSDYGRADFGSAGFGQRA
ncbi:hypothetical protein Tco_0931066 [Tanacetum coccineum]